MLKTLKKIYKELLIENIKEYNFNEYYYFTDETNKVFALSKKISENERQIIASLFSLLKPEELYDDNYKVVDFLFGNNNNKIDFSYLKYFLVKTFNLNDDDLQTELYNLLKQSCPNLYVTKRNDVYLLITNSNEYTGFLELLQSIESDFMIKLIGYESDYYEVNANLPNYFQFDFSNISELKQINSLLVTKANLVINKVINIDTELKKVIKSYILKEFLNDLEMQNVIKAYFETNFNTSLAAKNCYMHRNTFLNKLDKFISATNLNIRNYDDALVVYLTILM